MMSGSDEVSAPRHRTHPSEAAVAIAALAALDGPLQDARKPGARRRALHRLQPASGPCHRASA
jgi:hypothetical protein